MDAPAKLKIAADIGGTFTDIALFLPDGRLATRKLPSTPDGYARGVVTGILELATTLGLDPEAFGEVLHGCTVATNAILEHKGARTALLTTRGFRDVLELRRIRIPRLYDAHYVKPPPLAPRPFSTTLPTARSLCPRLCRSLRTPCRTRPPRHGRDRH